MTGNRVYVGALAAAFFAVCVAVPLSQPESEINHAPVPETQPWSTTFKEAAGRTAKRDIAPKPRVARQERMGPLTDDQREYISKQILQAISEMLSREGCSVDHPLSDRDYQGWMDFGRRSAEERLD